MAAKFVKVVFDLSCKWAGFPPEYRIYVNHELMTERTYNYSDQHYIREMLQILGSPGEYTIRLEKVGPQLAEFKISNTHIHFGPGEVIDNTRFRIL
jgi:hypothetical protein